MLTHHNCSLKEVRKIIKRLQNSPICIQLKLLSKPPIYNLILSISELLQNSLISVIEHMEYAITSSLASQLLSGHLLVSIVHPKPPSAPTIKEFLSILV